MRKFKHSIFFVSLLVVVLLVGCNANNKDGGNKETTDNQSEEKIVLKLATHTPSESSPAKHAIEPFMDRVTELTDGRVEFDYYPGEQLGKGPDALNMASGGITDIAYFTPNFMPSEMPIGSSLVNMPGLIDDPIKGSKAFLEVALQEPMLEIDFLRHGVRPLSMFVTPTSDIFTDEKEIKVPEDLKGFKIRTSGGVFTEALDFVGSTPTQIPSNDFYNAFSSGVVNGVLVFATGLADYGWDELVKYGTRGLNFGATPLGFMINENVFQGLPEDVQDALLQAGEEVSQSYSEYNMQKNDEIFEKLIDSGNVKIYDLSDSELEEWNVIYEEFKQNYIEQKNDDSFTEVIKLFEEIASE